jgi:hypothetical protein
MLAAMGVLCLVPAGAAAAPRGTSSTSAYLVAANTELRATIASVHTNVQASIDVLNSKYAAECPGAGTGAPVDGRQNPIVLELVGAGWATSFRSDARIIQVFARAVEPLRWSDARIARDLAGYVSSLKELSELPLPDLCADIRSWSASGFETIPAATAQFDRRLEAIQGEPPPLSLLAPYERPAQRILAARFARLESTLGAMETMTEQTWGDMLLETLSLPQ